MSLFHFRAFMPTKLGYRIVVCFCLMSLIPILSGVYIGSIFIKFPFDLNSQNLFIISMVSLLSLSLSLLGYFITRQLAHPIEEAAQMAKKIAENSSLDSRSAPMDAAASSGVDELEDLARSLKTISLHAKELLEKVDKLSMKDKVTGLYNAQYIRERLDEEIDRAAHYQRSCGFAYFKFDRMDTFEKKKGSEASLEIQKAVADTISGELSEFDRAARITRDEFVVIFPDRSKKKCIEIVSRINQKLESIPCFHASLGEGKVSVYVGISENPIDGVCADDLYKKALKRIVLARERSKSIEALDDVSE